MTTVPAPPDEYLAGRIADLERRIQVLERSNTNSPKFWTRAFAILGHTLALWGILYGVFIIIAIIATAAGDN